MDPQTPNPTDEPDLAFMVRMLRERGWVIAYSTVLDEPVLWYGVGRAREVPRYASEGLVSYREDELAILSAWRASPEHLRNVHEGKRMFPRSRVVEAPTAPIDWQSPHVGFVWDPQFADANEPVPGVVEDAPPPAPVAAFSGECPL